MPICKEHNIGYISVCPSCEWKKNHKKDKHTHRKFKKNGNKKNTKT